MKRVLPYALGLMGVAMIIAAFSIVATPTSRNVENYELARKNRGDRLVLLAVCGVFLVGSGTVWAFLQRIEPPE